MPQLRPTHLPDVSIIEFLTGAVFVLAYIRFDVTLSTFKWLFFSCILIILIVTDLRVRLLPDAVVWPGFGIGLVLATRIPTDDPAGFMLLGILQRAVPPSFYEYAYQTHPVLLSAALGFFDALLGAALGRSCSGQQPRFTNFFANAKEWVWAMSK